MSSKRPADCICVETDEIIDCEDNNPLISTQCQIVEIASGSSDDACIVHEEEPVRKRCRKDSGESEVQVLHVDDKKVEREVQIIKFERAPRRSFDVEFIKEVPAVVDMTKEDVESDFAGHVDARRVVQLNTPNNGSKDFLKG